jgi:hypothetical protein
VASLHPDWNGLQDLVGEYTDSTKKTWKGRKEKRKKKKVGQIALLEWTSLLCPVMF